jgi:general secretion pathway protein F
VVPQIAQVLVQNQQTLPVLTRLMLGLSQFVQDWGLVTLVLLTGLGLVAQRALKQNALRLRWDRLCLQLPGVGGVVVA